MQEEKFCRKNQLLQVLKYSACGIFIVWTELDSLFTDQKQILVDSACTAEKYDKKFRKIMILSISIYIIFYLIQLINYEFICLKSVYDM